ncbi:glutathione S-transferase domain-containing protein [Rhizobium sp. CIAT894]|uniref:glutathione S-transferase family protein n=1 Tax=Rhizobium sp. CIAT894 TaxID=2020312 RepID=UPI000A2092CC|nr:glutathione S-transferase family protein [Rhizobium sp. CIAT894]ARM88981.1 glutathione S-transferase domain-containing protein [Rhizobium sp. CIAT894]
MYILFGGDFTRATLVQWVLEEGKIEYELRKIDIINGEHRSAEFLAINPAGLVPVLITPEGDALYEVAALMLYLADRHQLTELAPTSTDPDRGHFLSAIFHIAGDIQSEMKRFHFPHRFSLRSKDNGGIQNLAKSLVMSRLRVMNTRLAQRGPYVLGTRFSLADFYLCFGSHTSTAKPYARSFRRLPGFTIWFALARSQFRISKRPRGWQTPMRR